MSLALTGIGNNNIIESMKTKLLVMILLIAACGGNHDKNSRGAKFRQSMIDIEKIASMSRITDDNRSIYQIFGPGDTIAFYQRLLITDAADTSMYYPEDLIKPYGKNLVNGELYTLNKAAEFPSNDSIWPDKLPQRLGEETVYGVRSPDSNIFAFETVVAIGQSDTREVHRIFLVKGDSTSQLSFGDTSVFLDRFSNTGRYLSAIYGTKPTWLLIYDLRADKLFRIEHDSNYVDYLTSFSPTDSMMMFIRSDSKYRYGRDFFGDIWLVRFNEGK